MNVFFSVCRKPVFRKLCSILVIAVTILACTIPMSWSPVWNGERPQHRNQYEKMAQALLDGHLYLDHAEPELAELANPYDPDERSAAGVTFQWDHAYYNGYYYMYFGIVPVLLVFLPYLLITGVSLTTYHATQVFVAATILGFFALFRLLSRLFFKELPYKTYLFLCTALSLMSVWLSVAEPALYCTAITAGIALEIWSLYFFIKAVWDEKRENMQILLASVGSFLGALVFGCRPPIGLANLLVIPALVVFLKQRPFSAAVLGKLILAALPYVFVGAALMAYNYVRFDNPFEFGQSYQLTVADQSNYGFSLKATDLFRILNAIGNNLLDPGTVTPGFPYVNPDGAYVNFPVLWFTLCLFDSQSLPALKRCKLMPMLLCILLTIFLISFADVLWSPYLIDRYRMDIYFLAAIPCFVGIGIYSETCSAQKRKMFNAIVICFSLLTIVTSCLFWLNTFGYYHPETIESVKNLIRSF